MSIATYQVSGMTCQHCINAVDEELHALPGVETVEVELVAGGVSAVTVTSAVPLTAEEVQAAVDEAGYDLVDG